MSWTRPLVRRVGMKPNDVLDGEAPLRNHVLNYLERGSSDSSCSDSTKSNRRDVAGFFGVRLSSPMTMNPPTSSGEIRSYVELQHQIHDALREQHPEWVQPNGDCPTCESYETRLAELIGLFQSSERKVAA